MSLSTESIPPVSSVSTCIPPRAFARNQYGLICDDFVAYSYAENGMVDWRKMVKPEYLVPHKQVFEKTGKPIPTSIEGLTDKELLILLGGIKELASIRGFTGITYKVVSPTPDYVVAVCQIDWIPNYETEHRAVTSSGIGDASPRNVTGFGKNYLGPFAENRAFVRCVRQFLRINVVSQEEIDTLAEEAAEDGVTSLLKEAIEKYKIPFELIKTRLVEEGIKGAENFTGPKDIPRFKQLELVESIKRKAKAREEAATEQPS